VLDSFWTGHIGHCAQIDYVVKLGILEGWNPRDTILYLPRGNSHVANRFLLSQWGPHLRFVEQGSELPFPESSMEYEALNFYVPAVTHPPGVPLWELAAQTYRRWSREARGPLLKLDPGTRERGRNTLASAGVPRDAWFVCLHVRGAEFFNVHRTLHNALNAQISDYLTAIEEVVQRGGWVVRMGNPKMAPLPPLRNVLDYPHTPIRSDWMDVYLAADCRFFLGTSSGLCYVAQDYGVPCLLTNWWPPAQRPWQPGDIFIPKLHRREETGEFLTLQESLQEPFGYCNSVEYLRESHDLIVVDNDPEDIRAAVVEMFARFAGSDCYCETDLAMRDQAEAIYASLAMKIYKSPGAFGSAQLARDFLRRHPRFLQRSAARTGRIACDAGKPGKSR